MLWPQWTVKIISGLEGDILGLTDHLSAEATHPWHVGYGRIDSWMITARRCQAVQFFSAHIKVCPAAVNIAHVTSTAATEGCSTSQIRARAGDTYALFFDGGASNNTGAGGAGSFDVSWG